MTKIPRWILLLLIFLLLVGVLIYLKDNPKPGLGPYPETTPPVGKQIIEEGSETGMYLLKIEYPKISGLKDSEDKSEDALTWIEGGAGPKTVIFEEVMIE